MFNIIVQLINKPIRCPQVGVRFEDEHMRTKSRGRSAPSLSHDRLVPPTMREDQRVCVRI